MVVQLFKSIGINLLQDNNGDLIEVGLFPEEIISVICFSNEEED